MKGPTEKLFTRAREEYGAAGSKKKKIPVRIAMEKQQIYNDENGGIHFHQLPKYVDMEKRN